MSKIRFPSDSITIGQMRSRESGLFSMECVRENVEGFEAISVFRWEARLAELAFCRATGMKAPDLGYDRDWVIEMIGEAYEAYGISSGPQQTKALVRDFESQAISQAKRGSGPSR